MYNHRPENYICPLCKIARGEPTELGDQEGSVIFRDDTITSFIAGKWWRSNPGHVIIIPNSHIENLYDLPDGISHKIFGYASVVAIALKATYNCDGTSIRQHNEPAGNQDVWHFHLHIFPRYLNDDLYLKNNDTYWPTAAEKQPYADKLKTHLMRS